MPASETAGVFTCAELVRISIGINRVWKDNQVDRDLIADTEVLRAIKQNQTAQFPQLESHEKDEKLKVYWATDCNTSLADCTNDCVIGGPEAEAKCKEYELDICKTAGFTVREKYFRQSNLSRQEIISRQMLARIKELDEDMAQRMVAKLNAVAGVNQFEGIGNVAGDGTTYISAAFWTPDIYGYFIQVAKMNKLSGVYMLHGNNLWQTKWQADLNSLNVDKKDGAAKLNTLPSFWDPFNVDSVNVGSKVSYMITKGALAIVNKAYYPLNSPIEYKDDTRWSIISPNTGFQYDVVYTNTCLNNEIYHKYSLYNNAGIFDNPYGCNEEVTGVLKFVCGEAEDES